MFKKEPSQNKFSVPHPSWGAETLYFLSHRLWMGKWRRLARIIKLINTLVFRNYIDPGASLGRQLQLAHGGFGVVINYDTIVGRDAIIFHNVTLGNQGIRIGDRVYLGAGTTIIGPCVIGDDAVIGANTFVNFDVPSGATVVGQKGHIVYPKEKHTA